MTKRDRQRAKKHKAGSTDPAELRRRAEARLPKAPQGGDADRQDAEARRLLHELQVHQTELTMQNEELLAARHEAEEGLARYTELFDFAPIGYAVLDPDENIRDINHAGAQIFGADRARLIGQRFGWLLDKAYHMGFSALVAAVLGSEQEQLGEVVRTQPGGQRTFRVKASLLARRRKLVLVAFEDVTEERAKERKLAKAETELREGERRKDEFLAMLSHELRNPLAAIRTSLDVISRVPQGSSEAGMTYAIIDRQVDHLTRLVDDLLDVTRITRGKVQLKRELVEMGELVRRTMDDQGASFAASKIELEGRFEPGPFWINADPARVVQVVSNVLINAKKFTPAPGRVEISLRREGSHVVLRVRDTGIGISAELLPHLFEPFAQAPQSIDRARGGLGIGLAMVEGLVKLQGGTVTMASEGLGHGTEITMSFPLEAPPAARAAPAEERPAPRRRVLVIEDSLDSANALAAALKLNGHTVMVAYDGHAGIELARTFHPDVVLCDIGLPEMSGYAVAKAFRADPELKDVWLVALTGYAQADDVERAREAGFNQHLAKPAHARQIDRILANARGDL